MASKVSDQVMARARLIFELDFLRTVFFHVPEHEDRAAWQEWYPTEKRHGWAYSLFGEWRERHAEYLHARGEPARGYRDDEQVSWLSFWSRWNIYSHEQKTQLAAALFEHWSAMSPQMPAKQRSSLIQCARQSLEHESRKRDAAIRAAQAASVKAYRNNRQLETLNELNTTQPSSRRWGCLA